MAEAKRRGYGEDGIYFDHRGDCRDGVHHKTCAGRWRGVVSLGFDVDGKRIRKKVGGQTKGEVKEKLKALHSELDAGIRITTASTVEKAVADWLDEELPGRTAKTVEANRDSLRPLLAVIGPIPLRDLTVQDVPAALKRMAATHATRTLQKAQNCLTRAVRHAEGQDLVRRNVSALVDTTRGREGRPSQSLTLTQATALLETAEESRLHAYIVLCLLTGVRSEGGAGTNVGSRRPGGGDGLGLAICSRLRRRQDIAVAPDAEAPRDCRRGPPRPDAAPGCRARQCRGAVAGARPGVHHYRRNAI
jgi:Phage integrase central domain